MAIYTIKDFQKSEKVYHLSNEKHKMIVIGIQKNTNKITCQWVNKKGRKQSEEFKPEELGKAIDLSKGIYMG